MINELNREEINRVICDRIDLFISNQIDENNCVYISKAPVEIRDGRFRVSVYRNKKLVKKVTLVAVEHQSNDLYMNCDTDELHKRWLNNNYGEPKEIVQYGVKYTFPNMIISSEHDPRSGSDIIIIIYQGPNNNEVCVWKSINIYTSVQNNILRGCKLPHSTSQPVIYNEKGKYYLAVFVFFFTREDIETGMVDRPTMWVLADIETGEIIEERQCKDIDFSDAPYDIKYNVRADAQYDTSKEYYDEAFLILDSVRDKIINMGKLYKGEYQFYLDKILANIPKEYQRFYTDLSV